MSGGGGITVLLQIASGFLPFLVWIGVLAIGAVVLPRSRPAGALVMLAATLALGVLLINSAVALGVNLLGGSLVSFSDLMPFLFAKQGGTVLLMSLVHVMLLGAVFIDRKPVDSEE